MPPNPPPQLPHLFDPTPPQSRPYKTPYGGGGPAPSLQARDRAAHAEKLLSDLTEVTQAAQDAVGLQKDLGFDKGRGVVLQFESDPGFELKLESLDVASKGIELLAVRKTADSKQQATIFVPDGQLEHFIKRVSQYAAEDTTPRRDSGTSRPKNEALVANIASIRMAALQALWTDAPDLYPDPTIEAHWEVWLRRNEEVDYLSRLREIAGEFNLAVSPNSIEFIDRTIVLVRGTGESLAASADILGGIAELRLAKEAADFFTGLNPSGQMEWITAALEQLRPPPENCPYVTLLDTGVNAAHPLLKPLIADTDLHAYKPAWGKDDRYGHGTPMAGLAGYGDLTVVLGGAEPIETTHRLESVKAFNDADQHRKDLYGAVTTESISRAEITAERPRVFCMAISAIDNRDRGRPSSWSATVDELASGRSDGQKRLFILSAGNTVRAQRALYPDSNFTDPIHDPGQSWNALTVGGFTEKCTIDQAAHPGWQPVSPAGDLAPCSTTSMPWKMTKWPIKPDIVLEAGNMAKHPAHAEPDYISDGLQLLSTHHRFALEKPLISFGDTSAATALASNLAATLWARYPSLTPEAIRALLIHFAEWTPAMRARFTEADGTLAIEDLLRCYGYGIPNPRRLLASAANSLTLIVQSQLTPFQRLGPSDVKLNELNLHPLPWPTAALQDLGETEVQLKITLSYFVEPNPGDRGWTTRYGYASHGLRFALKRPTETPGQFEDRINKASRSEDYVNPNNKDKGTWTIASRSLKTLGSLHSDTWTGRAADLANCGIIAVYPTYGWWARRPRLNAYDNEARYALIATITTPETDIYTPVASQIAVPIAIQT